MGHFRQGFPSRGGAAASAVPGAIQQKAASGRSRGDVAGVQGWVALGLIGLAQKRSEVRVLAGGGEEGRQLRKPRVPR